MYVQDWYKRRRLSDRIKKYFVDQLPYMDQEIVDMSNESFEDLAKSPEASVDRGRGKARRRHAKWSDDFRCG